MDFNPFREENQLATGAVESEIYIWDINTNTPTTLSRSQQSEDVQHIAWNKQGLYKLHKRNLHETISINLIYYNQYNSFIL